MDKLAGYSSDTESEQFDKTSPFRAKPEHSSDTTKGNIDLAAEWESFEKLIAGDDDQGKEKYFAPEPIGVPAPVTAPSIILKPDELYCVENGQKETGELESEISKPSASDEHKTKRSLPTDSSESGSELESDDSSDDSEESSEESSASDEPDRKKPRHGSKSKTPESSSSEDESEEETSEDGSEDCDTTSPDEDKQKKSSTDEENVPSRTKDNTKKRSVSISRKVTGTSSAKHRRSHSGTRRSRSHDKYKLAYHERKRHDRSRTRKHHRQHSRHRSHRSRSHDRRHQSRSRTRPHHHRRSRSADKRKRSSRHHSRSRSRDRHPPRPRRHSRDRHQRRRSPPHTKPLRRKPLTYKEVLRQKLIEAQHQAAEGKLEFDPSRGKDLMSTNEKPSPLPLMSINPLMSLATGPPGGEKVTPQQALMQTMAAMHQKAQELTGVAVPKYYNPAAVNPLKFAEQVKKRKLLWSKKDSKAEAEAAAAAHQAALAKAAEEGHQSGSKSGSSQWKSTAFLEDKDGRMAAKFRKLMGIKDAESSGTNPDEGTEETIKKQQELFNQLDKEYQFARMTTHTHRGIGLGFTTQMYPDLK